MWQKSPLKEANKMFERTTRAVPYSRDDSCYICLHLLTTLVILALKSI